MDAMDFMDEMDIKRLEVASKIEKIGVPFRGRLFLLLDCPDYSSATEVFFSR
jgi:hypothetical protein